MPLHESLLQFLRILPSLREGKMRRNCKKSSRSPQATMLALEHGRLNATFEKPWDLRQKRLTEQYGSL